MHYQKNWCFTLNNYSYEELNRIHNLEETDLIGYIIYQCEEGESGTPHIQGYVQFAKKLRIRGAKRILGERCHLEPARGNPYQNKEYCTKEEGRIEGPYEYGDIAYAGKRNDLASLRDKLKSEPNICVKDLLEEFPNEVAKYPQFIKTCRNAYNQPDPTTFIPNSTWQRDLSAKLIGPPDSRKIEWYFDAIGNNGKSYFSINWRGSDGRRGFTINGGKHSDVIYAYEFQEVIFFDLCRDCEERAPYALMESFKNGFLFNSKYNSQSLYFKTPHVIVFSNFYPDKSKLSEDRWEIIEL